MTIPAVNFLIIASSYVALRCHDEFALNEEKHTERKERLTAQKIKENFMAKKQEEQNIDKGKQQAINEVLQKIERQFGKGSIMKLGDEGAQINIETISTGCLAADVAIGAGGVPRGRITEIYGPESSGKTTVTLHVIAEAQKAGGTCAFIDAEHALDPVYAKSIGVDIEELIVSQPDTGEQALDICDALVRSGAIDVIVIDSVAALVPKAEITGDMGDSHMGLQARLMSQALRKIAGIVNKSKTAVIFINQLRMKIGVVYGNPETTTGGNALKFYASLRLDIRRGEAIKNGDQVIGNRTRMKVVKNKIAPPFKTCEFDIMYGEGISKLGSILDVAVDKDLVKRAGAWYSYGDIKLGQGREKSKEFLTEHPEILEEIQNKVYEMLGSVISTEA